jgi:hypothetical protein
VAPVEEVEKEPPDTRLVKVATVGLVVVAAQRAMLGKSRCIWSWLTMLPLWIGTLR